MHIECSIIVSECNTVSCIIILIQVSHKYSTKMFPRIPVISLHGNSNQITTPFSAERLRSLDMFNSRTTLKNLYQEKEINERIHRKLPLLQSQRQKVSNPEQARPETSSVAKN